MRWPDYPFYLILTAFACGTLSARFLDLSVEFSFGIAVLSLLLVACSFWVQPFKEYSKFIFTGSTLCFFLGLGAFSYQFQSNSLAPDHYKLINVPGENSLLVLELSEQLSSNTYNNRFYAQVRQLGDVPVSGKILVLFKRSDTLDFKVGDRLTLFDDINDASNARNPGDFNYKEYLESIDVYGQVYVDKPRILKVLRDQANLPWYVELRNQLLHDLSVSNLEEQPRALIEALVLGQRQNVDPTISQNFRDAGVIHILALSGLHVGILLLILKFCLKWMLRLTYGMVFQTILIIALLWSFALLTGMSPSIMRAVMMFSFIAIGMNLKRKGSVFHSLTISALVLLFIDSRLLFHVGFQLSYTAVLAIVLLQPLFASLLPRYKGWLWRNLWQIFTVTMAAQIGVAPLSIYYFHQFPLLFLLGNMLLLFMLPLILVLSISFIAFLKIAVPTDGLGEVLNYTFNAIIDLVAWISSFDSLVLTDLRLTPIEVILWYLILLGIVLFLRPQLLKSKRERLRVNRPNYFLHGSFVFLIGLLAVGIFNAADSSSSFVILHQSRGSAVAVSNGAQAKLLMHSPSMDASRKTESLNRLKNTSIFLKQEVVVDSLPASVGFQGRELVVIDESAVYSMSTAESPMVLLSHSPKLNLNKLISTLQPKLIIADGSNYRNMVGRWEKTCRQRNVEFINTYEHGAVDLLGY